ncbi:RagB/SusD family nutrient uptake outer membrane protein [Rhizosphaericola mali]|uniref:RagB/SusD family nutrient uptake outer membrane protein n=1 Tax=Rhizosphaericola mali TaxID=2545455 RepID=A0A5P2G5K9_9BACT|nr:RagB/SusD family nutrient uptake outer membrane protein [Rhizosphaericola mali]QES89102.1 RagB/SusD family nutrient uptake outer membrane protein [Rhizosphaericola mali]
MKRIIQISLATLTSIILFSACTKKLDQLPYVQETSEVVYTDPDKVAGALAKLYAGYTLSGQDATDYPDISTTDVGTSVYLRLLWEFQELPTDEAVIGWNDNDLLSYHNLSWAAAGYYNRIMYDRIFFEVAACNEFIREVKAHDYSKFTTDQQATIAQGVLEARFLRAFAYWTAMDLYGNVPFTTETDGVGAYFPKQIKRADLFNYVSSELRNLSDSLPTPGATDYGRANQGASLALLSRLYLNASVYTGTDKYDSCVLYSNKIINSGWYSLNNTYANNFKADNNTSPEMIFPLVADGTRSKSYGNTTFIIHSEVGGNMNNNTAPYGIASGSGWGGMRATKAFVNKFGDPSGATDKRAIFYTDGQNLEITTITSFTDGYAVPKFINLTSTGAAGSDPTQTFADTDFPLFRLAEIYLNYAEATLRGASNGDNALALGYLNALRQRAYGNTLGNITANQMTLNYILDERCRELYFEAIRRTDLVRYNMLTTATYLWPFKGGSSTGTSVDSKYNIFPIPTTDLIANPTLVQNTGY